MAGRSISTTHFGLLCLLSVRPSSAYELVAQMRRSVGAVWPRASSNLYADLKRLAADGLASTTVVQIGRRPRTMYDITASGRAALATWLAEPGDVPSFECEALLKLAFATMSSKAAALAQVAVVRDHAESRLDLGRRLANEHIALDGPLPERLHINAVMWKFLWELNSAIAAWASWAEAEIGAWPHTRDSTTGRERGRTTMRETLTS